jgi:hypothetical protein
MPFVSKRPKLQLSDNDLEKLKKISRSRTEALSRIERAKIILFYYEGETVSSIARLLKTNRPKVERVLNKALELGAITAVIPIFLKTFLRWNCNKYLLTYQREGKIKHLNIFTEL